MLFIVYTCNNNNDIYIIYTGYNKLNFLVIKIIQVLIEVVIECSLARKYVPYQYKKSLKNFENHRVVFKNTFL